MATKSNKNTINENEKQTVFITKYIDTFKMIVTIFGFLVISAWLILGISSDNQNILLYIANGLLFYIIYAIWNRFDNRKVFSSVELPKDVVKPLHRLSKQYINGLILVTTIYWICNQLILHKSIFNLNEIPNWIIIILLILCGFKFIVKLLEAKLITHYIKVQASVNMSNVMNNDFMQKMKKEIQREKMKKQPIQINKNQKNYKKKKRK